MPTVEACCRHGIHLSDFLQVESEVGGLEVSESELLRVLQNENAKLKKPLTKAMLDIAVSKEIAGKKW